ncbi:hypothetical protein CYMTET_48534 [Cymbomonas tetramitiformis]|uniref:Uncharacterized protein n=1 Tax=Cymbomonas tetramitiformis TaxID=36881 RepID=A0AAE0BTQ9_9CHLO|nr:hypothetical protein CYMTET_48534 [Cymbomonas tetramitiformis]
MRLSRFERKSRVQRKSKQKERGSDVSVGQQSSREWTSNSPLLLIFLVVGVVAVFAYVEITLASANGANLRSPSEDRQFTSDASPTLPLDVVAITPTLAGGQDSRESYTAAVVKAQSLFELKSPANSLKTNATRLPESETNDISKLSEIKSLLPRQSPSTPSERSCGPSQTLLCWVALFGPVGAKLQMLLQDYIRILARPGRCDAMRFYIGQEQNLEHVKSLLRGTTYQGDVQVLSTDSVGPWRRDYLSLDDSSRHCVVPIPRLKNRSRGCANGYENRWEQTLRAYLHMYQEETQQWDWIIQIGFDTLLIPENWRRFLQDKNFCSDEPHYLGYIANTARVPFALGCGFAISKRAQEMLGEQLTKAMRQPSATVNKESWGSCLDVESSAEDLYVAICLGHANIRVGDARDARGREYFLFDNARHHRGWKWRPDLWYNRGRNSSIVGSNCCADYPVLTHHYSGTGVMRSLFEPEDAESVALLATDPANYFSIEQIIKAERRPLRSRPLSDMQDIPNNGPFSPVAAPGRLDNFNAVATYYRLKNP